MSRHERRQREILEHHGKTMRKRVTLFQRAGIFAAGVLIFGLGIVALEKGTLLPYRNGSWGGLVFAPVAMLVGAVIIVGAFWRNGPPR